MSESVFESSVEGSVHWESDCEDDLVATEPASKRRCYATRNSTPAEFLGLPVCRLALAKLLGVGSSTLAKIRHGQPAFTNKCRPAVPKHPMFGFSLRGVDVLWHQIIMYLWTIYHQLAECMPTGFKMPCAKSGETAFPDSDAADADEEMRLVNAFSISLQTVMTDVDVNLIGPGTFKGAARALPHGSRTELYWDYVAFCEMQNQKPASYSQFMRVVNPVLKPGVREGHLRFRKVNEHGQCDQCYQLRRAISKAKTPEARAFAQKEHHRHVLSQWLDRQVYWSLRSLSQSVFTAMNEKGSREALRSLTVASSVLTVMADGMDQAKYMCPRVKSRFSKLFTKLWRPKLHVGATWCHGEVLKFFIADDDMKKDSAFQIEMITRALDDVLEKHGCLPDGLSLHHDNTCRESKNQYFMAWASLLPALGVCRWVLASYLRPGHRSSF